MPSAAVREDLRIVALERYRVLGLKHDADLDGITRLAADVCATPIALVSLVDRVRQRFVSRVGLETLETPREQSFCSRAIEQPDEVFVVASATSDLRFADNALVTGDPHIRFYAGMPIVSPDGFALGTLCVIDVVERGFSPQQERVLRALAAQAASVLEARREIRELRGLIDQRAHVAESLERVAYGDPLSGIPRRAALMEIVGRAYARMQADPRMRAAVALVGVEGVKLVDESLGHGAGDSLMRASIERIASALRVDETVARYGDNQIVVLIEDIKDTVATSEVAKRILAAFDHSFHVGEHSLRLRANVGITVTDGSHQRAADLVRDATSAMYHARSRGEGTFELFTPTLRDIAVNRLCIEGELRVALDAREFRLHFQPIVAVATLRLVGIEALIRWQHPRLGLVMPDQFIEIAEQTGLIEPIGEWVVRESCRQLSAWQARPGFEGVSVSVNVSAKQFRNATLFATIERALHDAGLDARRLCVELTETALMEQNAAAVETLRRLRDLGVAAHLDDFGCGYSSLNYLRQFPVTALKIDRSFISGAGADIADPEIVQAVIALAAKLNMSVTAEGVETQRQLRQLRTFGCPNAQGYLLSKPLWPVDLAAFVEARGAAPMLFPEVTALPGQRA